MAKYSAERPPERESSRAVALFTRYSEIQALEADAGRGPWVGAGPGRN
jgi:hypothetical protein